MGNKVLKSFRVKIAVFGLLVALIPLMLISILFYCMIAHNARALREDNLAAISAVVRQKIEKVVYDVRIRLTALAHDQEMRDGLRENIGRSYPWAVTEMREGVFQRIALFGLDGEIVQPGIMHAEPWLDVVPGALTSIKQGQWYISPIIQAGMAPRDQGVVMAVPVKEHGEIVALLAAVIPVNVLRSVVESVSFGRTGHAFLANADGVWMVGSEGVTRTHQDEITALIQAGALGLQELPRGAPAKICFLTPVFDESDDVVPQWIVGLDQQRADAYRMVSRVRHGLVFILLAGVFLVLLTASVFSRRITRHLSRLKMAIGLVREGDFNVSIPITNNDETGQLAAAFNGMMEELKERTATLAALHREVAERRRVQQDLEDEKRWTEYIADHAAECIFIIDPESTQFLEVNQVACDMLGYTREELLNMCISDLHAQTTDLQIRDIIKVQRGGIATCFESRHRCKDGRFIPVEICATVIRKDDREVAVAFTRDITDRKEAEEQLRNARDAAEAANRARDQFLAVISHEMRTPLFSVSGYAEQILRNSREEPIRDMAKLIGHEAENLQELIDNLLDHSTLLAGKLKVKREAFDVRELLDEVYATMVVQAGAKALQLDLQVENSVPRYVVSDKDRLRHILLNLLSNAVKFTEAGQVILSTGVLLLEQGNARLRFVVQDTGIGIPASRQHVIFDPFVQADENIQQQYGGTGLGIAIARRLTEALGGELLLKSEEGVGSTFWFELPLETSEQVNDAEVDAAVQHVPDVGAASQSVCWQGTAGGGLFSESAPDYHTAGASRFHGRCG